MRHYCDTSVLASLYLKDTSSHKIAYWMEEEATLPLPLPPLLELELVGAIQQRLFRKQFTFQQAAISQRDLKDDIDQGMYKRISLHGEEYSQALQLVQSYTATIGCRALDVLHVASALVLRTSEFVTCDQRQKMLAEAVGLKVVLF